MSTDNQQNTITITSVTGGLLLATFVYALASAWPVMIALGVLHSQWNGVPAFGFLAVFVLLWAADLVGRIVFSR